MTEEQIKQNAEQYADGFIANTVFKRHLRDTYIAGAHSHDEEIEELKERLKYADESIADADKWIAKYKLDIANIEAELNKLRNPWISTTKQLPDDGEKVNVAIRWIHGEILYDSDVYHEDTGWEGYDSDDVIAWAPIHELKKGGEHE